MMRTECFQIGPGAPYDWTRHAGQQWLMQRTKEMGVERTTAFVNSPPHGFERMDTPLWWTNGYYQFKIWSWEAVRPLLGRYSKTFPGQGLPFDYISPINEPQVPWDTPKQEGCRYSNEDTIRAVLAIKKELDAAGVTAKILINETNNPLALANIDLMLQRCRKSDHWRHWKRIAVWGKYCENIKGYIQFILYMGRRLPRLLPLTVMVPISPENDRDIASLFVQRWNVILVMITGWSEYRILGEYGPGRDSGLMAPALHISRGNTCGFNGTQCCHMAVVACCLRRRLQGWTDLHWSWWTGQFEVFMPQKCFGL